IFFREHDVDTNIIEFLENEETSSNKTKVTIKFGVDLPDNVDDMSTMDSEE
ncbi:MAG: hypothetical protein HUK15_09160, partial [Bacteroidales bacterium]|nr:hypothetical protein [Bacteroidales bacterium]